jgi:hypothetical protein
MAAVAKADRNRVELYPKPGVAAETRVPAGKAHMAPPEEVRVILAISVQLAAVAAMAAVESAMAALAVAN